MQRLEVSGAVRPIYGSLGVKRLMALEPSRQIFDMYSNIEFHENPSIGGRVVLCGLTDKRTDMTKPIVAFRNSANAPRN